MRFGADTTLRHVGTAPAPQEVLQGCCVLSSSHVFLALRGEGSLHAWELPLSRNLVRGPWEPVLGHNVHFTG